MNNYKHSIYCLRCFYMGFCQLLILCIACAKLMFGRIQTNRFRVGKSTARPWASAALMSLTMTSSLSSSSWDVHNIGNGIACYALLLDLPSISSCKNKDALKILELCSGIILALWNANNWRTSVFRSPISGTAVCYLQIRCKVFAGLLGWGGSKQRSAHLDQRLGW